MVHVRFIGLSCQGDITLQNRSPQTQRPVPPAQAQPDPPHATELAICETGYRELKTYLRGPGRRLRGRTPDLARQELWAYLVIYQAIRFIVVRAAARDGIDPARISFTAALHAVHRTVITARTGMTAALHAAETEILDPGALVPEREHRLCRGWRIPMPGISQPGAATPGPYHSTPNTPSPSPHPARPHEQQLNSRNTPAQQQTSPLNSRHWVITGSMFHRGGPVARPPGCRSAHKAAIALMVSRRAGRMPAELVRSALPGPVWPRPPNVRVSPGVCLPPTSATGAEVTADAACSGAPVIVHRYLAHKEVAVHGNPDAGPGARIAAFAGLRPVLGEDRLTVGPAWLRRMACAEPGRFSVASMISRRAGQASAELMWSPNESLVGDGDDRVAPYVGELGNRHFGAGRHHAEPDREASLGAA
jgi:hypothetical protein